MPKRLQQSEQALALLYHARAATPFFSQGGQPCASIPSSVDSRRVLLLRSADFRDWLTANYYSEYETAPSSLALRSVLRTLEARAQASDSPVQKVDHRVSFEGDPFAPSKVFLDLANPAGELLKITSQGWTLTGNLHQSFTQSPGMLPLPSPVNPQALTPNPDPLQSLAQLFHLTEPAQVRVLFWLASAIRPIGPYPILVLRGPAASGKSVLARALRALIDPSAAPLRRLPRTDRELLQLAPHNWILVFDQVHRIPIKISEALCAVSSGVAIETAQPDYRDSALAEMARPVILIAPLDETQSPWVPTRSLSNRSLTIHLDPIAAPRPEAAVWSDFEALRAPALAVLADAVSSALRDVRDIDIGPIARFSDSVAWAAAAAPVLGLHPAAIVHAVSDPESIWLGADPLRDTLYTLLLRVPTWSGNSSTLLTDLRAIAPLATLPSTPKALGQSLARIPGISVSRDGRVLTIARVGRQNASSPTPNP
jgi:putative DNA primase/helicase